MWLTLGGDINLFPAYRCVGVCVVADTAVAVSVIFIVPGPRICLLECSATYRFVTVQYHLTDKEGVILQHG